MLLAILLAAQLACVPCPVGAEETHTATLSNADVDAYLAAEDPEDTCWQLCIERTPVVEVYECDVDTRSATLTCTGAAGYNCY